MKLRRVLSLLLVVLLVGTLVTPTVYAAKKFDVEAKAALLVDGESGHVLYAKNEHQKLSPASITKVMTALLVLEAVDRGELKLSDKVTANASAFNGLDEDGSTAGIEPGETLTVEELLYCMLVVSANETCNIMAEKIAGSVDKFVDMMNARAKELGCEDTHFANAIGLTDAQHYTSAWDIYLIAREAMKSDTFMAICNTKAYTVPKTNKSEPRELHSTNYLISNWRATGYLYDGAQGIKTGSTEDAGHCLVSSAVRDGRSLISVVLGAGEVVKDGSTWVGSFVETSRLFDYGFDNFAYQTVVTKDEMIQEVPVALSKETSYVLVHPEKDVQALLPVNAKEKDIERTVTLDHDVANAPIAEGDKLGKITISYQGEEYASAKLLAVNDVNANRYLVIKYNVSQFFSKTIVKIAAVVVVLLLIALFIYFRFMHHDRRYGHKRRGGYRSRGYRGRRRF